MLEAANIERHTITSGVIRSYNLENKVVVDIGSSIGTSSKDIICKKKIRLDMNKKAKPDIICNLSDGLPLKNNSADVCVAGDVLEHVYQSRMFMEELRRVLRPGGLAFISVPNICSLKYRVKFLFGGIPSHAARADHTFPEEWKIGHVRDYNFTELVSLFKRHGFKVIKEKGTGMSLKSRIVIPHFLLPRTLGDTVIVVAKRKE